VGTGFGRRLGEARQGFCTRKDAPAIALQSKIMPPLIAIPLPHFSDPEYAERAIPQYEHAVALAGGEPVRIPLDRAPDEVSKIIVHCDAVLLPGSKADVDPARFHAARSPHTAAADPRRDAVDNLLLDDAYRLRKPVLGICYGLQSLNVYHAGSLVQHIPDFLPPETRAKVNHEAGGKVAVAHEVEIDPNSKLAGIVVASTAVTRKIVADDEENREGHGFSRASSTTKSERASAPEGKLVLPVNSSHHQSVDAIGKGLRIVARCTADGIIEALEGTAPDHFVLAVQWHPERSAEEDAASRAIFRALLDAAESRRQ
jgi:putative glutamine amidotransferase